MLIRDTLNSLDSSKLYKVWLKAFRVTVFCIFLFYTFLLFSTLYVGSLYRYVYKISAIVLVFTYILFRRLRDGIEFKLLFAYCVWLVAVRIYDGGLFVEGTKDYIVNQGVIMPLLGFALLIPAEKRLKWLDIMAVIYCAAFTVIGVICIYGIINQVEIMNPLEDGILLCKIANGNRLYVFSNSCNAAGAWYAMACALLAYLFFRYRKLSARVFVVILFVVCYLVIALTYSRSCMLSFSISLAMVIAVAIQHHFKIRKTAHKAIALVLVMCICAPLAYKSFTATTNLVNRVTIAVLEEKQEKLLAEAAPGEKSAEAEQIEKTVERVEASGEKLNNRGASSSGRTKLWYAALISLRDDPARIITGSINSMEVTNRITTQQLKLSNELPHHHNSYLELLMYGGLPGFLLMMAVLVVLVLKSIRLFFTENSGATPAIKSLTAVVAGIMVYNMFETSFIHKYYICTAVYFVVAGYILAYEKELCGKKTS